jgi:hypothetical protein
LYTFALTLLLGGVQLTAKNTTTAPNPSNGTGHAVLPVRSHGGLQNLQRLPKSRDLEQVQTSAEQQVAELDGLLLERSGGGDGRHVDLGGGCLSNGYVAGPRQEGGFVACARREMRVYGRGGGGGRCRDESERQVSWTGRLGSRQSSVG